MQTVKIEIELPKEAYELAKGLGAFAAVVKKALADGWQMGADVPVIVSAALTELVPALNGVDMIGEEAKADPVGMGQALIEGLRPVFKKV